MWMGASRPSTGLEEASHINVRLRLTRRVRRPTLNPEPQTLNPKP